MFRAATHKTVQIARKGNDSVSRRKEEEGGGRNKGNIQKRSSLQLVQCWRDREGGVPSKQDGIWHGSGVEFIGFSVFVDFDGLASQRSHGAAATNTEMRAEQGLYERFTQRALLPESLPGQYCIFGSRPPAPSGMSRKHCVTWSCSHAREALRKQNYDQGAHIVPTSRITTRELASWLAGWLGGLRPGNLSCAWLAGWGAGWLAG